MKKVSFQLLTLALGLNLNAATYYVATNGSDSNSGTSTNAPFATPQKALSTMAAGDTIYVRGGTYATTAEVKVSKSGFATNYCELWNYPGEKPVFDCSGNPSGARGIYIGKDYWHVRGIEVVNSQDNGILISGGYNIVEGCVVHDSNDDGIYITSSSGQPKGHDNLVLNCDSYRNYQAAAHGNNGDGFAAKTGCGVGNIFRGCRAWNNSDDGWDFYDNDTNTVVLEGCWAFANGLNLWGDSAFDGNGNGFKLGGASTHAQHIVKNCVAFDNVHDGFDQNHTKGGQTIVNCTAFRNGVNFQFPEPTTVGRDLLTNNISYLGPVNTNDGTKSFNTNIVLVACSWKGFTVTAGDFASVDANLSLQPRNADFSLPNNGFARLAAGSDLIDAGVNVGLPYNGSAPDLGAYEFQATGSANPPPIFDTAPTSMYWNNGNFCMRVAGLSGQGNVIIQASSNLVNWQPVFTNPPVTGTLTYLDPAANGRPLRFYRAEEK